MFLPSLRNGPGGGLSGQTAPRPAAAVAPVALAVSHPTEAGAASAAACARPPSSGAGGAPRPTRGGAGRHPPGTLVPSRRGRERGGRTASVVRSLLGDAWRRRRRPADNGSAGPRRRSGSAELEGRGGNATGSGRAPPAGVSAPQGEAFGGSQWKTPPPGACAVELPRVSGGAEKRLSPRSEGRRGAAWTCPSGSGSRRQPPAEVRASRTVAGFKIKSSKSNKINFKHENS